MDVLFEEKSRMFWNFIDGHLKIFLISVVLRVIGKAKHILLELDGKTSFGLKTCLGVKWTKQLVNPVPIFDQIVNLSLCFVKLAVVFLKHCLGGFLSFSKNSSQMTLK